MRDTEPRGQMPDPCRYWKPLDIEPTPDWVGWALMPARLLVAAFLHLEQALKPEVADDFGYMFRTAKADSDDRMIRQAIADFDRKHGGKS